jgi:hypothetical protein
LAADQPIGRSIVDERDNIKKGNWSVHTNSVYKT